MKLYSHSYTRGVCVEWWVKELQAMGKTEPEVEIVPVDFYGKKHKEPQYLKINPFGRIPALEDGDLNMFESGAITMYIGEKLGAAGLDTPEGRARHNKWVTFANSTLPDALFGTSDYTKKQLPEVLTALDKVLEGRSFLEDGQFGAADVAVGGCLIWARDGAHKDEIKEYPNINRYVDEMAARPQQLMQFGPPETTQDYPASAKSVAADTGVTDGTEGTATSDKKQRTE